MELNLEEFQGDNLLAIIIIIIVAILIWQFSLTIMSNLIRRSLKPDRFKSRREEELREKTLVSITNAVLKVGIIILAFLLILAQLGVNIGPMLAGAGIVGVALGFGFQSLVKDWVSGTFILLENQYRVGDVVRINQDVSGTVESLSLRQTVLRDLDGMVHHVPNGTIDIATNMTMEYANINLDIKVGYNTDIDNLEKLINEVGDAMFKDKKWSKKITQAPYFERVDDFADSAIVIKILGKTLPMEQWSVAGELRRRLKKSFDKNGIEIPFPQRTIHQAKK